MRSPRFFSPSSRLSRKGKFHKPGKECSFTLPEGITMLSFANRKQELPASAMCQSHFICRDKECYVQICISSPPKPDFASAANFARSTWLDSYVDKLVLLPGAPQSMSSPARSSLHLTSPPLVLKLKDLGDASPVEPSESSDLNRPLALSMACPFEFQSHFNLKSGGLRYHENS